MHGKWLREANSNTAIIFIHGILSSGETCWKHSNGAYWPNLVEQQTELEDCGIYVYTYQTGFFSGTYNLGDVVDDLKERFKLDGIHNCSNIVFVCHSMGGIVVRRLLVQRSEKFQNTTLGLYLVASPSLGSDYANMINPYAKILNHSQTDALKFSQNNTWLNDLDKDFKNLKESGSLNIIGKELIEDKALFLNKFIRKQIVEPISGARYFGEAYKVPQSDHLSIAKPENAQAIQHRLLNQFIKEIMDNEIEPPAMQQWLDEAFSVGIILDFTSDDLKDVILALHDVIKVSEDDSDSKSDFLGIDLEEKNKLNSVSEKYSEMIVDNHETYFGRIKSFLRNPINRELSEKYFEVVDELRTNIAVIQSKDANATLQTIMINFVRETAKNDSDTLRLKQRVLNVLVSYMYVNCDIGKKS